MALSLKYFARYRDINGEVKEIRFLTNDWEGAAEEWFCTDGAVTFDYGGFDGMFDQPIVASQAQINLHLSKYYDLSEFVYNRKTFFCEIWNTETNEIQWTGWVEPWNARRPHRKPPWNVSLTVSCGLAHLSKKKYLNKTNVFKKTGLQIIQECLETIGATQKIRISTHMVETTWGGDDRLGLNSFEINTARYYDQNGEAMYCDVIVNDILNHFNAEILQDKNRWVIRAVVDNATGFETGYIDINDPSAPADMPFTYVINDNDLVATADGGEVSILAPINKYRTEIDFGTQMPFFENGNMVLWTENGLVAWDFSHMPKGNPGWERFERGGEITRGVLQINGKSPNPIRKKRPVKKKNQWLKNLLVLPLLVDAIKLVSKKSWMDIEPAQYIESPGGIIERGDESVTISFDYETEAFSPDILISIRIPLTQKSGKVVNFWVDPSEGVALAGADKSLWGADEEFHLIRIPAVDMGSLTDKGTINVSGNPNYPVANFTPGSKQVDWTWTVEGVPAGQTRKIGGVNGVIVENGDLIVARIPNNGGTQAEVGGRWEVINVRNNIKKGTFTAPVAINQLIIVKAGDPWPADKIYVRFYKMADDKGFPGDWYRVYNLNGALEGFVAKEESAQYATTLQRGDVTDEEAKTINLISGDYNPWYSGSWTKPGLTENTRTWRRRPSLDEGISIYRAMMLDRLCLTSRPLRVVEGNIVIGSGEPALTYLHTLIMKDMDDMRMRITRFSYNDYTRRVRFTAVEVKYEEIPGSELKQDAYIPGSRQLNTIPGQGDGVYPTKQDSTNGRLSAEDVPLSEAELLEAIESGSRLAALFENIPPLIFIAGELSTESVDLNKYLSEIVIYNNENQEEEDLFDFNALTWETVRKPAWVTDQRIVFLNASVTGKPLYIGQDSITFKVGDPEIEKTDEEIAENEELAAEAEEEGLTIPPEVPFYIEVTIPIQILPKTKVTYELFDATGEYDSIGALPGQYPVVDAIDIAAKINGQHDGWQMTLEGGGSTGKEIKQTVSSGVNPTDSGKYFMFIEDGGFPVVAGQYKLYVTTFLDERIVSRQNVNFILYDAEFLNKLKFFLTSGGGDLGEISADGTSKFIKPASLNIKAIADDVNHDKAVITLYQNDVALKSKSYTLGADSLTGTYLVYDADSELATGFYTVEIILTLEGEEVLVRYADFTINEEEPEVTSEGLQIGSIAPNTTSFKLIQDLVSTGNSLTLPTNWTARNVAISKPFNSEEWILLEYKGEKLIAVDISLYTKEPQIVNYATDTIESTSFLFGKLNSTKIGKIHKTPSTFRLINTRRMDGATIAIYQSDFSFGAVVPIEDVEVSEPGNGIVKLLAGNALNSVTEDSIQTINWQPDELTLTTVEPESPNDPDAAPKNVAAVKLKGITYPYIQDMPAKTVLGNPTTADGTPRAISITKLGVTPDPNDIPNVDYIDKIIDGVIDGTANYVPRFGPDGHSLINSTMFQYQGNIGIGTTTPIDSLHVVGSIIASKSFISQVPTNTPPLIVASTTLVTNLHAHYVSRNVVAGTGLTGGGLLTADRTLAFDTVWGDDRYALKTFVPTLQSVLTAGNTATNQTMSIQGPAGSLNYISRFGYNNGWLEILSGTSVTDSFLPTIKGTSATSNVYGVGIIGQGQDSYSQAAILLSGRNTSGTGTITGKVLSVRNYTTEVFSIDATGNSVATGVITAIVGNSTQWSEAYSWGNYALKSVVAGNGITGGGGLATNPVITLGTPSQITQSSTNSVTSTSHTHAIDKANLIAGTNVSFTGSGTGVLLGTSNLTINVGSVPWSTGVSGKPTSLSGFGILDGVTTGTYTAGLATKENTFAKGDIIQGFGLSITGGSLLNKLVGSEDVTFALSSSGVGAGTYRSVTVDSYGRVTGGTNPTTIAQYGLTDVYTKNQVDIFIAGRAQEDHTHTSDEILNFPEQVRLQLSAGTGITFNQTTGVISATGSAGPVGVGTQAQRRATSGLGKLWVQTDGGTYGAGLYYFYTVGGVNAWIRLSEDSVDYTFTGGGA
ncbi:hypothetical protein LZG74_16845 [Dyadobacter sp. CY327]|uniref:hypothetical protein n=1 Tax=Dyadobacter sp. CY327 TaxID=2907301 RepID=UPI001F1755AA|nr:hypothetical protein [Dyadobacter sp. CY327]MCE7071986.1 hypothetical protein [Dyadobacter sp. CY327]